MKKIRTLVLTLVIFLLLIAALFFVKSKKQEPASTSEPTSTAAATIKVIDLKMDDIKEITVADATQSLTYIPEGGAWHLQGHEEVPINEENLNYKCERILQVEASRSVDQSNLQDFGLEKPVQTVTYTLKDGNILELLIGTRTQDTTNAYVKLNTQDSPIYLVSSLIINSFVSNINDLRDTKLEEYDTAQVTGLTVKGRDIDEMQISLATEQNSLMTNYVLTTPSLNQVAVDGSVFKESVQNLPALEAQDFIADGVTDLSPYGLDDPQLHLIINVTETDNTTKESSTRTLDYIWGNELDDGKIAFMKTGDKSVYAMDSSFLSPLLESLDPFKLSYKWIALVGIDTVKAVDLHLPDGDYHFTLDQDNAAYTLNDKAIEESKFKDLYTALIDIKADTLVTDTSIPANDQPAIYFTYTFKDGSTKSVNFYSYTNHSLLSTLNDTMTVSCSLKQFTHLEQLITEALSTLK